jgi:hypothetical protein
MLTLTSQALRSDREMFEALERLLAWGRKYLPKWFDFYVWVAELQARGVVHFHLLLPHRIPKGMFRRLRGLWAEKYGMGPGSVDILKLKTGKGAASYLSKMARYVSKCERKPEGYRLGLDAEGMMTFDPWRVGRSGQPYERVRFHGRASDMSRAARALSEFVIKFSASWGAFPGLSLKGGSLFFNSAAEAEAVLIDWLSGPSP